MALQPKTLRVALSVLSSTARWEDATRAFASGIRWMHYDVMDGRFTPRSGVPLADIDNLLASLPPHVREVHLMVQDPAPYLVYYLPRVDYAAIHVEACTRPILDDLVAKHQSTGKLGLAFNPTTAWEPYAKLIQKAAYVIVMSVVPGAGGQTFMPAVLAKIAALRAAFPDLLIVVDGGINDQTAPQAFAHGASGVVVGSYLLKNLSDPLVVKRLAALPKAASKTKN